MSKTVLFMIGIAVVLAVAIHMFFAASDTIEPITRPDSVPSSAVYEGGEDGGNWIDCSGVEGEFNLFHCTVYEGYSGAVLHEGDFRWKGARISLSELKELLGAYSGPYIHLKDGSTLVATQPTDSLKL